MRVRPFFWLLLVLSCTAVLIFAATKQMQVPAVMQVHINQQHPDALSFTTVKLHLTDPQGLPIEEAEVFSSAAMTNMSMAANSSSVRYIGQGNYVAQLHLYMPGPWAITVQALADGFATSHQTLFVQVQ